MPRTFQAFWGFEGRNQRFGWVICRYLICRYLQYLDLTSFKPKAFKESLGGFREKCMFEHVWTGRFVTVEAAKTQALSDCWHKASEPPSLIITSPNKWDPKVNRVSWGCVNKLCHERLHHSEHLQWVLQRRQARQWEIDVLLMVPSIAARFAQKVKIKITWNSERVSWCIPLFQFAMRPARCLLQRECGWQVVLLVSLPDSGCALGL